MTTRLHPLSAQRSLLTLIIMSSLTGLATAPSVRAQAPVRETLRSGVVRENWSQLPLRTLQVDTLAAWDLWGPENDYTFSFIMDAAGSPAGFYLIDYRNRQVVLVDRQGRVKQVIGRAGEGPGEFGRPRYLDFLQGELFVADFGNQRLSVFGEDGRFLRSHRWRGRGQPAGEEPGIRVLTGDQILYALTQPNGRWTLLQQGLESGRPDELAVLQSLKVVHTFITGPDGQDYDFDDPPTFAPELLWTTDGDQRILTVTSDTYQIEERDRKGRVRREMVVAAPELPVSERDREWFLAGLKLGFSGAPGQAFDATPQLRRKWPFAEQRPALAGLALDPLGRLWVSANTTDPARTRLDLFDADLRYLGSREDLPLPMAFSPEGDALCRIAGGEDGEDSWLVLRVQARVQAGH
jgi:hypothetical protein